MYWQILSKRPADLAKFYGSIFGWNISPPDALGSRSVQTGSTEGIAGGI
jgi:predicted enzyme related to lactoylglutathione lyase